MFLGTTYDDLLLLSLGPKHANQHAWHFLLEPAGPDVAVVARLRDSERGALALPPFPTNPVIYPVIRRSASGSLVAAELQRADFQSRPRPPLRSELEGMQ